VALADELISDVDSILLEFAPSYRTAYKRTITRSGGNPAIGRSVSVTTQDVILSPQPVFRRLGRSDPTLLNNKTVLIDDYSFVLSVNTISRSELISKDVVLVLKDESMNEEVLRLIDFQDPAVNNTVVAFIAYFRSTDRA